MDICKDLWHEAQDLQAGPLHHSRATAGFTACGKTVQPGFLFFCAVSAPFSSIVGCGVLCFGFSVRRTIFVSDFFRFPSGVGFGFFSKIAVRISSHICRFFPGRNGLFSSGPERRPDRRNYKPLLHRNHFFCSMANSGRKLLLFSGNLPAGDLGFGKRSRTPTEMALGCLV